MKKAVIYPRLLIILVIWVTYLVLVVAAPRIGEFIEALSTSGTYHMPAVTGFVINVGRTMSHNKLMYAFVFAGISFAVYRFLTGERVFAIISKTPLAAKAARDLDRLRFYSFLAMFMNAGMTVTRALDYTRGVVLNNRFRRVITQVRQHVANGLKLSLAMKRTGYFDEEEVGFVETGENTGDVAVFASRYATICEKRYEMRMLNLVNVMPVVSLVIISAYLLAAAIVLLFPMYDAALRFV